MADDRAARFSGVREVPDRLSIDAERLAGFLATVIPGFAGPLRVRQFKGGQSNPTYLVEAADRTLVLRRKPPGTLLASAHAVDREARVMSALSAAGFPTPHVFAYCEDPEVIGTPFFVMEHVAGRIIWDPAIPGATPAERGALYRDMGDTLADLHRIAPSTIGLTTFGRSEGYVHRQITRWSRQYGVSATIEIPEMDRLMAFLPSVDWPDHPPAVVHGDYRIDNLIFAADTAKVRAVLDWELATLGDPVADFAYHAMSFVMPRRNAATGTLEGLDLAALGIPPLEEYVARYEARTGLAVAGMLDLYLAYNLFRFAAIIQGIVGRVRDGTATSETPYTIDSVIPLAEAGWERARRAGA
ncbi:phosphotransferase family protein [Acuticoccus mangrovi]|uniref:Phosphotransferase family protein n=1 Tax=Acuticoccus mangrovi TaxID=2796142 RepID=A0A934IKY6_9HYPH|nr:phosphotransferase family protein [Acuticoccus mangrovi]MBJ3776881.1 phosphotransferase family protein [Acuticoccus mangrovi]